MSIDKEILKQKMSELVWQSSSNYMEGDIRIYDPPLLGFARADDPLFEEMKKEHIAGDIFKSPVQWLSRARSVIIYFLPFSKEVRRSNLSAGPASIEWLHGRFKGEEFNNQMRSFVLNEVKDLGFEGVAPLLEESLVIDFDKFRSSWSERHAAYAAGLGTFSHNRGLITTRGMAGRFGSVIVTADISPSTRPYQNPFSNCPWMRDGSCGSCIERCPSGAITKEGKDKAVCYHYLFVKDPLREKRERYGYPYSACGKCQTGVPCEEQIPEI